MGSGGKGGGGSEFVPTETQTSFAPQLEANKAFFEQVGGLGAAPVAMDPAMLGQGKDIFMNTLSGGLRGDLEQAALDQSIGRINTSAVQAGRYGSMPQNEALMKAGTAARLQAYQPEMQAAMQAPQAMRAFDPAAQTYSQQVAGLGNLKNLIAGNYGTKTVQAGGTPASTNPASYTPARSALAKPTQAGFDPSSVG